MTYGAKIPTLYLISGKEWLTMIALATDVFVRTEANHERRLKEGATPLPSVCIAEHGRIRINPITHLFTVPEGLEVTAVYAATYHVTDFIEDFGKFKQLDLVVRGNGIDLEAQAQDGADGHVKIKVVAFCEVQAKR